MTEVPQNNTLDIPLDKLKNDAIDYFDKAELQVLLATNVTEQRDCYWDALGDEEHELASSLIHRLLSLASQITHAMKTSPLVTEPDRYDLVYNIKSMKASLLLRVFRQWNTEVLHDEGYVLGTTPPGQTDGFPSHPQDAKRTFLESADKIKDIIDLINVSQDYMAGSVTRYQSTQYNPNTAFLMMSIDHSKPELVDLLGTVKNVFKDFGINAVRADEIEHEGKITDRILQEIETSEFLFADLTDEKPNVYYEVGYAHALKRRVILYRKEGTKIHFDLAGYNCPGYKNFTELDEKLRKRLEQVTNKQL